MGQPENRTDHSWFSLVFDLLGSIVGCKLELNKILYGFGFHVLDKQTQPKNQS